MSHAEVPLLGRGATMKSDQGLASWDTEREQPWRCSTSDLARVLYLQDRQLNVRDERGAPSEIYILYKL